MYIRMFQFHAPISLNKQQFFHTLSNLIVAACKYIYLTNHEPKLNTSIFFVVPKIKLYQNLINNFKGETSDERGRCG
jgi:hypothetical protein